MYTTDLCSHGDIRLVGGIHYGRVELCFGNFWSTICSDDEWDDIDAQVICKQLGYSIFGMSK